jgi:hypothetical protein
MYNQIKKSHKMKKTEEKIDKIKSCQFVLKNFDENREQHPYVEWHLLKSIINSRKMTFTKSELIKKIGDYHISKNPW